MKFALALLTLFTTLTVLADEIDDRNRRNAERQAEESRQQTANYRAKGNQERLIAFNGFVANHGGLRSGTCTVATEDCSRRSRYYESSYCPMDNVTQSDINGLGASGEYVVRDCRVVTGDNSACVLSSDSERNSYPDKMGHYKATCTPEGGAAYLLTFNASGREYRAAPIKEPKPEKEVYSSRSYRSYSPYYGYGYGFYGYGRGHGSRVNNYNCYGENCNYYGARSGKKKRTRE